QEQLEQPPGVPGSRTQGNRPPATDWPGQETGNAQDLQRTWDGLLFCLDASWNRGRMGSTGAMGWRSRGFPLRVPIGTTQALVGRAGCAVHFSATYAEQTYLLFRNLGTPHEAHRSLPVRQR